MLDPFSLYGRPPWPVVLLLALMLVPMLLLVAAFALLHSTWSAAGWVPLRMWPRRLLAWATTRRALYLVPLGLACVSAWLLSACGTRPLPAATSMRLPAELMRRSSPPVLLMPASTSSSSSATSASTPASAPPTGRAWTR